MAGGKKMPKKLVIAVCGGLNWDLIMIAPEIPISGECLNADVLAEFPGGKGGNAAIALVRLSHEKPESEPVYKDVENITLDEHANDQIGAVPHNAFESIGLPEVEVRMLGAIGMSLADNRRGIRMKNWLRHNWVNVDLIQELENERSAVAFSLVEADSGANRALIYPASNHLPKPQEFTVVRSLGDPRPDLVVLELEMNRETVSRILRLCKEENIETCFNPAPAHFLPEDVYEGVTHLIVNETEAAIMSGRDSDAYNPPFSDWVSVTDYFLGLGVKNVVVTLEDKGAFFSNEVGNGFSVPAVSVPQKEILDTAGAGDTFVAAYAIEWLKQKHLEEKWNPEKAVMHANRSAAKIIQKVGCQEAIPWASDFDDMKQSLQGPASQEEPTQSDNSLKVAFQDNPGEFQAPLAQAESIQTNKGPAESGVEISSVQ